MQHHAKQENPFQLYVVTDRRWLGDRPLGEALKQIAASGATCIQLREKNLTETALLQQARIARENTRQFGIPLIINDHVSVCEQSDADGVHLGQQDGSVKQARARLGPHKIIGVTAKTPALAQKAEQEGADYIGAGAIFGTQTKSNAIAISCEQLREICASVRIPVVAIGGIDEHNVSLLSGTGIAGVAVVSAIFAAPDLTAKTRQLRQMVDGMNFAVERHD